MLPGDEIVIGKFPYTLEKLARGGMGCVFLLAQDQTKHSPTFTSFSGRLALKAILPEFYDDRGIELFKNELTICAGLQHPNIVRLLDIIDGRESGWMAAMKWHNGSLRDILRFSSKLSQDDSAYVMCNILKGLSFAYLKDKIIHLDLKPENILFDGPFDFRELLKRPLAESSSFLIADWGIASFKSFFMDPARNHGQADYNEQGTLNNHGTIKYMAPERFQFGVSSSIFSDVYSLGVIYAEMLTCGLPFDNIADIKGSIVSGQYLSLFEKMLARSNIPKHTSSLIMSMISLDIKNRPDNFDEIHKIITKHTKFPYTVFSRMFSKH